MNITVTRAHLVILFAILFITIGWVAPLMYASYAPQEQFIEVNSFEAQDATVDSEQHKLCFDRNVKQKNTAKVFTKLYLVSPDSDKRIQVDSTSVDTFLEKGDTEVQFSNNLPNNIEAGAYKYVLVIEMDLADGRVERVFDFESEQFRIAESEDEINVSASTC